MTEDSIERAEAEATARERGQSYRQAYGADWLARVQELPAPFVDVALAAGDAHLRGVAEDAWLSGAGEAHELPTDTPTDPQQPHADATNLCEQAISVLRDAGLWPWQLATGPDARVSPDTVI
jgi:hypothetical protein